MLKRRAVTSLSCASYTYSTQHGRHGPLYIPHQHTARFTPTVRLCIHYSISQINAHHKHYFLLDSLQPSPLTLCHQSPLTLTGTLHPSPSLAPFIPHPHWHPSPLTLTGTLHPSSSLAPFIPHPHWHPSPLTLTGTLHPSPSLAPFIHYHVNARVARRG